MTTAIVCFDVVITVFRTFALLFGVFVSVLCGHVRWEILSNIQDVRDLRLWD
jgi:hypothetical protein